MTEFLIYGKPNCPYCDKAKQLITHKGDKYDYRELGIDISREDYLQMVSPRRTVPMVYYLNAAMDQEEIGGYEELTRFYNGQ